jgi:cell division protein FtsI/penicillin-binding protein 2
MHFNLEKSKFRLLIIVVIISTIFIIVISRLIFLTEIFKESKTRSGNKQILRGSITDRRGISLALTEEASTIGINPKEILDPTLTAQFLAGYLDLDQIAFYKKYT